MYYGSVITIKMRDPFYIQNIIVFEVNIKQPIYGKVGRGLLIWVFHYRY